MNKFITFTLVLFACAAFGNCSGYGAAQSNYAAGPAVQRVHLSSLPNIESYLNGAQSAYGPSPVYANAGPAASVSYGPNAYAPALAPATSVVVQSAPAYSAAGPSASYSAGPSATAYGAPASTSYGASYGAAPKISIQPAVATQLYPNQHNYKAYVSPTQYNKVALPILPSEPVAKLFVPQQASYAAAPQASYSGASY